MKNKSKAKSVNINNFLYLGIGLIVAALVLKVVIPTITAAILNIMYIVGIVAFILYMWEIQYRRRTGDYKDEGTGGDGKKGKK